MAGSPPRANRAAPRPAACPALHTCIKPGSWEGAERAPDDNHLILSACPSPALTDMEFVMPRGYQPIYDPKIPFMKHIRGGLREGTHLYIEGTIPENVSMFVINLRCDTTETGDIAMHVNPRFDGWDKVIFNTFEDGSWGSEDKLRKMPFKIGERFELVITVASEGYKIIVNGEEYHTYEHRISLERVRALNITGDVDIRSIIFIAGGMEQFPDYEDEYPGFDLPGLDETPVFNPTVPCNITIPRGMHAKRTIIIRGRVSKNADRLAFNFVKSSTRDVVFHLNPRVKDEVIVRNSQLEGGWGKEERGHDFNPFREGEYFDMSIRCGSEKYKVFVNGKHLCDYSHRARDFERIDLLEIVGDVEITYIHF